MATRSAASSKRQTDFVEQFFLEEQEAMETLRSKMAGVQDAEVQAVFSKISEIRARYLAELESQFGETVSRAEITQQINEMFS